MKLVIRNDDKKDKAVSPIIATILIVAITVVLAATLYAVLGGFTSLIGKPTPSGSFTISSSGSSTTGFTYSLSMDSLSTNVSMSNVELKITASNGTAYTSSALSSAGPLTLGTSGYTISSIAPNTTTLSISTIITLTSVGGAGGISQIALIDTASGGTIYSGAA